MHARSLLTASMYCSCHIAGTYLYPVKLCHFLFYLATVNNTIRNNFVFVAFSLHKFCSLLHPEKLG